MHVAASRHSRSWNNDCREVVVYNTNSWPCSGTVTVEIGPRERVFDATSGAEVPTRWVQVLNSQATVELWVDEIEGLSYRRFVLRELGDPELSTASSSLALAREPATIALENDHYREQERLTKVAAYIAFPLDLADAEIWSDSQLGWVNGDHDQLPGGARSGCRCRAACWPLSPALIC
jgi:alpha-mannosidase